MTDTNGTQQIPLAIMCDRASIMVSLILLETITQFGFTHNKNEAKLQSQYQKTKRTHYTWHVCCLNCYLLFYILPNGGICAIC